MEEVNITVSGEQPAPIVITVSGEQPSPIVITTSDSCRVFAVNGKVGYVIIDKSDIGLSSVENISIVATSGYLQGQINTISTGVASRSELNALSGSLVASGASLDALIKSLSGYVDDSIDSANLFASSLFSGLSGALDATGSYLAYEIGNLSGYFAAAISSLSNLYYPISNPSGFITGFDSGIYVLKSSTGIFATKSELDTSGQFLEQKIADIYNFGYITGFDSGNYVEKSATGIFATNADLQASGWTLQQQIDAIYGSGFITGVDLSLYVQKSDTGVFLTNGDLANYYPRSNPSGFITGVDFTPYYLNSNPSGFITQDALDPYLTGFDSGNYVKKSETGIFALVTDLNSTGNTLIDRINTASGTLQNQLDNLDSLYATDSQLTGLSGQLVGQIAQTGTTLQNQINSLYNSGFITGFDSGAYVLKSETGIFATQVSLESSGLALTNKIDGVSGYADNSFATRVNLAATGVNLQQQIDNMKILAIAYAIAL